MPRVDQTIQINTSSILRRVLNENGTLAVDDVNSQPGHYLFAYTNEQMDIDGVSTRLEVTTIREFEDPEHNRLRKTITVKRRGNRVHSVDIVDAVGRTETRP